MCLSSTIIGPMRPACQKCTSELHRHAKLVARIQSYNSALTRRSQCTVFPQPPLPRLGQHPIGCLQKKVPLHRSTSCVVGQCIHRCWASGLKVRTSMRVRTKGYSNLITSTKPGREPRDHSIPCITCVNITLHSRQIDVHLGA